MVKELGKLNKGCSPSLFLSTTFMAREKNYFFKRLADTIAEKRKLPYSQVMGLAPVQNFIFAAQICNHGY